MTADAELTVAEACAILHPPITPRQLRTIITTLRIQPAGTRKTGAQGHPRHTYLAADIMRLHAALAPWLGR